MRPIPRGRIVRILILALALVGSRFVSVALGQTTDPTVDDYVTIKLKDGRVLEGPVLLEDNQQIIIEAQYANGTITHKAQVDKNDIASLLHLSATDRDQRLATIAYHDLGKYQLDPQSSFPLSHYDTAINEGFLPFLQQFPHARETATISNRLADWQAEQSLVASGQVKYHGHWMTAAEADKLEQIERTRQVIQDARALMAQGRFETATERLAPYYNVTQPPQFAAESRRLQTDVYRLWISSLETMEDHLTKDLEASKERVTRLSAVRSQAQANYDQARSKSLTSNTRMLGDGAMSSQASADYLRAEKQFNEEQNRQFTLQEQLDSTIHELREIHQAQDLFTVAYPSIELVKETPPPKTNAPAPPPPPPPPPPSVVEEMGAWFGRNWIIVAGASLLGLWGVTHLFTRS
ncbi:MAG: hypothetical protein ABSG14_08955 [Verrucomicrobiia bacterium]|jgi:hypothetical protein